VVGGYGAVDDVVAAADGTRSVGGVATAVAVSAVAAAAVAAAAAGEAAGAAPVMPAAGGGQQP